MNSKRELLHDLEDQEISTNKRAQLRCQLARKFEDQGDYEAARVAMGELWQRIDDRPLLEGLDEETKGILLLRTGVLTGWIGSARQITGAQDIAKNLLRESIAIFEALQEPACIAEAQIELAYCHWREGALHEGRILLREALSRLHKNDVELKAKALLRSAIIERAANRNNDALRILTEAAALFGLVENHCVRGSFHNQLATVLKNLGVVENREDYVDRALIEYAAAAYHFEEVGHTRYQACVENNLAMLFWRMQRFTEAHKHLDVADILFASLKDDLHRAQVDETRASVLLAEGQVVQAEKAARRAVRALETGDEPSLLAEALTTLGISLAHLRRFEEARSVLNRADVTAQQAGNHEAAGSAVLAEIEHLGFYLSNDELARRLETAELLVQDTQEIGLLRRLAKCGCQVASLIHASPPEFPSSFNWADISFDEEVERYEKHLIELALKRSAGSVTDAARLLDLSHQNLAAKIMRYEELRRLRKPIKQRKRRNVDNGDYAGSLRPELLEIIPTVRILVVEDNHTVADAVRETLDLQGWSVEICSDGSGAMERIASDAHYDLLLLDDDLPGMNGIELVRSVRQMDQCPRIPIIVFSANPIEAEALRAGADEFLAKPQGISLLVATITRLLAVQEQEP